MPNNSEPCLCLRIDLKSFEECSDDWELKQNVPIITQIRTSSGQEAKASPRLHGIFNQVKYILMLKQTQSCNISVTKKCKLVTLIKHRNMHLFSYTKDLHFSLFE